MAVTSNNSPTPMMQQYMSQKELHRDALLFFRMGDFFELFHDDAVTASKVLDIALTKRGKTEGNDIPMCGVPAHAYEPYLMKLIKAGFKVAICDQLESPEAAKKRGGYKEIVRREVVRVITPGTITEEALLDAQKANYLLSFSRSGEQYGLAWVDISTGAFHTSLISQSQLASELARLKPSEILLSDKMLYEENLFNTYNDWKNKLTPLSDNIFAAKRAGEKLKNFFKVISLDGIANMSAAEISASGALLEYLELTQKQALPELQFPVAVKCENYMQIDFSTRRNLELTESAQSDGPYLLQSINRCQSAAGGRLLYSMLSSPLVYAAGINARLDAVDYFYQNVELANKLRAHLNNIPDLERAVGRIMIGRGNARDMSTLRATLAKAYEIKQLLKNNQLPALLNEAESEIKNFPQLLNKLVDAFKDEAGFHLRDGNFIREGFSKQLDEIVNIRDHSRKLIDGLREKYATQTTINTLKISYNNMLGYFIEITAQHSKKMEGGEFIHRQTMANAMRFTTVELSEIEAKIISARDTALQLELEIFEQIVNEIRTENAALAATARGLAFVDFTLSLAHLAKEKNYTRPKIDDSNAFNIKSGRHPIVEENIEFTANDANLSPAQNLWLLTGPNMAGKSTFLRQNALIIILAQMGSFVPATEAHIGCVDRVFSRVGASDNLSRGQSTFMVEMVETAAIVNQATEKSFLILDEIGRGTATYDGLALAWAILEHIHDKLKCRTIFATHYHELTKLELDSLSLYSMKVKEWKDEIIFMHEVVKGAADKSYGIHVAQLAGLPKSITSRAKNILFELETGKFQQILAEKMPLFAFEEKREELDLLKDIDPNSLSPKEALDLIYKLKQLS